MIVLNFLQELHFIGGSLQTSIPESQLSGSSSGKTRRAEKVGQKLEWKLDFTAQTRWNQMTAVRSWKLLVATGNPFTKEEQTKSKRAVELSLNHWLWVLF